MWDDTTVSTYLLFVSGTLLILGWGGGKDVDRDRESEV